VAGVAARGTFRLRTDTPSGIPSFSVWVASNRVKCLVDAQSTVPKERHSLGWAVIDTAMAGMP
jgi:hypothetical protein